MVKTRINIALVRARQVYKPGDWIEGVVHVESYGDVRARAIRLQFYGVELTRWKEGSGMYSYTNSAKHYLWTTHVTLWGYTDSGSERNVLPAGSLVFPFRAQLPRVESLPASGQYVHGCVRYSLEASIKIALSSDITAKRNLTVHPWVPLNANTIALGAAVEQEKQCRVSLWPSWCAGIVKVRLRCLKPHVEPCKRTFCTVSIENDSAVTVNGIRLCLVHRLDFRAKDGKVRLMNTLEEVQCPIRVEPRQTFSNMNCTEAEPPGGEPKPTFAHSTLLSPFAITAPSYLPQTFAGRLITSSIELLLLVQVDGSGCCTKVPEIAVPLSARTELSLPPVFSPVRHATAQRIFAAVLLQANCAGEHSAFFSFEDMNYDPSDQLNCRKPVMYPCYLDPCPSVIPQSLDSFEPNWRTLLSSSEAYIASKL